MKTTELGWIAGIFEGEGCFSIRRYKNGRSHLTMSVVMTDQDVILRFYRIVGLGVVGGPYKTNGLKPAYTWALNGPKARAFGRYLRPHLGERRKARLDELLIETINPPLAPRKRDEFGRFLPVEKA